MSLRDEIAEIVNEEPEAYDATDRILALIEAKLTSDEAVEAMLDGEEAYDDAMTREAYAAGKPFEGWEEDARRAALFAAWEIAKKIP